MKLNLFVQAKPADIWETGPDVLDGHAFTVWKHEDMKSHGFVMVCPVTVEFDIPEGWDPRVQQLEALKHKKEELKKEFSEAVRRIDAQISRLQAIDYTPADLVVADDGIPF